MKVGASAVILKDKKILLIKRSSNIDTFPQFWACPGGIAEYNESPEEAVSREVREEINCEFTPAELFSTGKYKDRLLYRFLGDWSGEIKISDGEAEEWRWFSYEDAIKLKLAFDYREIIEKLRKKKLL